MINTGMIAKQYGLLPSQVREHGTTYDLMIYDVMMAWEQHQQDQANGKKTTPVLTQEQMMAALERVKKEQQ